MELNLITQYTIPLLPFIALREQHEIARAANATKRTKVQKIVTRFVSVNHMYAFNRRTGSKFMTAEGKDWKEYIADTMLKLFNTTGGLPVNDTYECGYVFFMTEAMMFTKDGALRIVDVSNMLKAAEDAVFDFLHDNDCRVTDIHGYKRVTSGDPKLVVLVTSGSPGDISFAGQSLDVLDLDQGKKLHVSPKQIVLGD